jgi:hypothetical protein
MMALVAFASVLKTSSKTVCVGGGPSSTNFLQEENKSVEEDLSTKIYFEIIY